MTSKARRGRVWHRLWAFAARTGSLGLLAAALAGRPALAQAPADPVEGLREALRASLEPEDRAREVQQRLGDLATLNDVRRALVLPDWRDLYLHGPKARGDQLQRQWLARRFAESVRAILARDDDGTCIAVAEVLGEMGAETPPGHPLVLLLGDFGPDLASLARKGPLPVRLAAARALGHVHPDPGVALPVLSSLLADREASARLSAAIGLEALVHSACAAPHPGRAHAPWEALAVCRAAAPVAGHGLRDGHPGVRRRCARVLAMAADHLARLAGPAAESGERHFDVAHGGNAEEKELRLHAAIDAVGRQVSLLTEALADDDAEVRSLAGRTLEEVALARARWRGLVRVADGADDPLRTGLDAALPTLSRMLSDRDPAIRRRVMDVLELVGPTPSLLPVLLQALSDADRFVRWSAVRTLGTLPSLPGRPVLAALAALLHDPDLDIRLAVTRALESLASRKPDGRSSDFAVVLPHLSCALQARDAELRSAAVRVLGSIGPVARSVLPELQESLRDPAIDVRRQAALSLGALGPAARPALEDLRRSLGDRSEEVRQAARQALINILLTDRPR